MNAQELQTFVREATNYAHAIEWLRNEVENADPWKDEIDGEAVAVDPRQTAIDCALEGVSAAAWWIPGLPVQYSSEDAEGEFEIDEVVSLVAANREDLALGDWLDGLIAGVDVEIGGGAAPRATLRAVWP